MKKILLYPLLLLLAASCGVKTSELPIINKALYDTNSIFYGDFGNYPALSSDMPIGIFDSGTGGLTVLEKFLEMKESEGERFAYLADQANMPYGRYDACGKSDYLRELVVKDALFLLKGDPAKIIVIACNTATAYGLESIEHLLVKSKTGVKVIGVINSGVKATIDCLGERIDNCAIGVLATPGTISSGAYERTIKAELASRGINAEYVVVNQKGYGFAEAVDAEPDFVNSKLTEPRPSYLGPGFGTKDGDIDKELLAAYNFDMKGVLCTRNGDGSYGEFQLNSAENYARFNLVSLVESYRRSGGKHPIKAIIMGCTHYPFTLTAMRNKIKELRELEINGDCPYRDLLDENLIFIDPAAYTARACYDELKGSGLLSGKTGTPTVKAYISVPSEGLDKALLTEAGALTYDFKYGREAGTEDVSTIPVPFSKENVDSTNRERIRRLLPLSYSALTKNELF